jgi:2',3'-cyclic-nucleotide 2'-phosphodiesterase (5'-nucleotidase family)
MNISKGLTIVQMNDSHAYLDLHQELFWKGNHAEYRRAGGYARIATILNRVREEKSGQVLAFDGGDTIHGTYAAVKTQGEALIPVLIRLGFDAMTAHWEFAYGPEQFMKVAGQLSYPVLACNVYDQKSHALVFPAYMIREVGGLRVGVIGIASNIVDKTMPPSFSKGIYFTLGNAELPGIITRLRNGEKVDLIVVLSHLGFPQDAKLAQEIQGIDVILSSHTHNRLFAAKQVGHTIIIQSGAHGSFLGQLDLKIDGGRIVDFRHQLLIVEESIPPDQTVQALVDGALAPYGEELSQVVGHTSTALHRNTMLESTMDNLLLQSILEHTGAQIAFSNGWRYGAPIAPGPITLNDLWNIIPVNPPISLVELTGDEIRTMLEENLEHVFAHDPYHQMGGYVKRMLGLNLYVKIENDVGQRIQQLFVQGKPVPMDKLYTAAFVTAQGVPNKYGSGRRDLDIHAVDALQQYVAQNTPVEANLRGTVMAV